MESLRRAIADDVRQVGAAGRRIGAEPRERALHRLEPHHIAGDRFDEARIRILVADLHGADVDHLDTRKVGDDGADREHVHLAGITAAF